MKACKKRTGMKIKENAGQWHEDVDRLHTYSNGDWVIVFTDVRGYYDGDQVCVKSAIKVKVLPAKAAVLKNGLFAFMSKGKEAHLVMRNCAL